MIAEAEAERRRLVDAEKAKLEAQEATVVDSVPAEAKRKNAASKTQPKGQRNVGTVVEAPAEPIVGPATAEAPRVKKPYSPEKLSGAAEPGKAPKKGQLPAGLLAYLAKKHAGSQVIAAAAGAPVKKARKTAKK